VGPYGERWSLLVRRGEIRLVDLEPVRGSKANKRRPAIIVSNDGANGSANRTQRGVITIVPITSNTDRVYPFQVFLPASESGLDRDSKAQAEQVRSLSVTRMGELVGALSPTLLASLNEALRLHLAL
jgi:mRNA interferase MazF